LAFVGKQRRLPMSEAVNEANSPAMDLEQEDAVASKAEAQEEKTDPPVGEAPLAPGADAAAAPTGLAAVPAWAWALGAVGVVGVIVLATRRGGGKGKKGNE